MKRWMIAFVVAVPAMLALAAVASAENFIEAMRTDRHMGRGRPILPPMPYYNYAKMTDPDLKAVFAYLRTLRPIQNRVPDRLPPETPVTAGSASGTTTSGTGTSAK